MKTVLFYSGRRARPGKGDRSFESDRAANSRARLDALFHRANFLALFGAAVCVLFFALCTARAERKVPRITDPDAAVAVMASVDERPADTSADPETSVASDAPAEGASGSDTASESTTDAETDTSIWSYLEDFLRRILRRESD